ncbi:MAG: ABC transporter substrate-binding protein [Thermodesulfobacteriota bacterium]|nr:ABC transporter substrate-binding protein [Thermodesulfobacteriota bacterium]
MKAAMKFMFGFLLVAFIIFNVLVSVGRTAEKEVLVGGIVALTGPVSDYTSEMVVGIEDYFAYVNKNRGVDGVKIKFKYDDNRYKTKEAILIYKKIAALKPVTFLLIASSGAQEAMKSFFERDKIPAIAMPQSDPQFHPPGWIFSDSFTYGDACAAFFNFFRTKKKEKIKIGWLAWDHPYGRAGYEQMKKYTATRGGEVLPIEYCKFVPATVMPQLLRLKKQGADYIWTNTTRVTVDIIQKERHRAGIKIPLVSQTSVPCDGLIEMSGKEADDFISIVGWYSEDYMDDLPQDFKELMKKAGTRRGHGKKHTQAYSRGMQEAMQFCEALRLTLKKVGYKGLSGETMMKHGYLAMKNLKTPLNPKPNGILTPDDRRLNPHGRFYKVQAGKIVPLSDWMRVPFLKKEVEG